MRTCTLTFENVCTTNSQNVPSIVALYSTYTRALTFENFCPAEPDAQLEQAVLLAGANIPAEQAKQEVAPAAVEDEAPTAKPAAQSRHLSMRAAGAKVPGGHASHDAALELTKVPLGQVPE